MKVLVTGGAGFIGSHYVSMVLAGELAGAADVEVTVLDKLTYAANLANLPVGHPRLRIVEGDVCDRVLLRRVLPGHDAVMHLAAESHVDRSLLGADPFVHTNVVGTHTVLEASREAGVPTVVHVSTDEVYGSISSGRWTEESPLQPNSPYAASKAGSDLIARAAWQTHRQDVRVTRCSNNYGPRQHPEKLVPNFVTRLLSGRSVPLYGDGLNVREWIHVSDHCRALHLVLRQGHPGETYNVGGGTELTNREMTGRLLELCGAGWHQVEDVADRLGHDRRYALDDTKIRTQLGYRPLVPFARGIAEAVAWYRTNPDHWTASIRPA